MKVFEKFVSISGEVGGFPQGQVCLFIRFAGCNLECNWCDTAITQNIHQFAKDESPAALLSWAVSTGIKHIVLTGGEPLLQKELGVLLHYLLNASFIVSVETNGSLPVPQDTQHANLTWVMDFKLPSSGHVDAMLSTGAMVECLPLGSVIKFPCKDKADFEYAKYVIFELERDGWKGGLMAFSPINPEGGFAKVLVDLVLEFAQDAQIPLIYSLQIHKFLGAL